VNIINVYKTFTHVSVVIAQRSGRVTRVWYTEWNGFGVRERRTLFFLDKFQSGFIFSI